jgi:hypothetical protein
MTSPKKTRTERPGAKHRSFGRRLSLEQQQEYISLDQCSARLSTYGWIRNELKRDHGEDVLIQIYEDGNSTGLSFLLQCKSTTDLSSLTHRRDRATLSYTFEVADLLHWEISTSPVVAVVWDVRQQHGCWTLVSAAIRQLDARSKGWRRRKSAAVHLPVANGTDDTGFVRLRRAVADHYLPIVTQQHQSMTITPTFVFPHDAEGQSAFAALQAFIDTGEPIVIDGKFIKKVQMPEWWTRLYGRAGEVESISMSSGDSDRSVACRLEIDTSRFAQPVAVPYVDLRVVRAGRRQFVLSNAHQQIPIHVSMTARHSQDSNVANWGFTFDVEHVSTNPYEAREAAAFSLALHTGKRLRLISCASGKDILSSEFPKLKEAAHSVEFLERWPEVLDKLCFIQPRVARFGAVRISKRWLRAKDEAAILRLHRICTTGEERAVGSLSMTIDPATMSLESILQAVAACEREPSNPAHCIKIVLPARDSLRIATVAVPLGRVEVTFMDSRPLLAQMADLARTAVAPTQIEHKGAAVVRRYLDWLPGGEYAEAVK